MNESPFFDIARRLLRPPTPVYAHTSPAFTVFSFRFRTNNPVNAGANLAFSISSDPAPNEAVTGFSVDSNNQLRIRFEVEEVNGGSGNQAFSLQYRINGGTWTTIGTATTGVRLYDGAGFTDGTATTNLITSDFFNYPSFFASSKTFLAGAAMDTSASSGTISWSGTQHTELDWLVEFVSADLNNGDQIEFQLDAGTQLATPPKVTVTKTPTNVIQDAFRIRGPQAASVAANAAFDASDPAIDTDVTWAPLTRRFRIRFRLRNTGSAVTQAYKLQYRINAGSWTDVPHPGTGTARVNGSTAPVEILDNSGYTDGAATTELLAGPGTFVAGTAQSTTLTTASIALGSNQETELEWTLWLNEYWDTPGHFVDGDTVDFRVVTSAGVALSGGYGTSDANIPRVTIDLNGTTGLAPGAGHMGGIWAENPGHLPIFWDTNGNGYWLCEQTETYPELMMLKTTDGGDSWAQVDQANKPATGDLEGCSIRQVGDTLHIAHHAGGGTDAVRYHTFRMSDHGTNPDTWGIKDEDVYPSFTVQRDQASAIAVRSSGEIIIAFTENDPGQVVKVARRNTSGTWQTPVDVWTGSTNGFTGVTGVQIGDDLYLFAHNDDTGNLLGKRYTSANALEDLFGSSVAASATGTVVATTTGTNLDDEQNYTVPVAWNDGSNDKIFIAWVNPTDDDLEGVTITVGSGGSVSSIGNPANSADNVPTGLGQSRQPTASIARDSDNGDLYAVFAREATTAGDNTLYYAVSTDDGATWGTNTAVTLRDLYGSRVNWVRATVQTVGGSKALRIVYDNANLYELYSSAADAQEAGVVTGHIWYDEVSLSSTTAVGKEISLRWDLEAHIGDEVQVLWNDLTPVADESVLRWDVLTPVNDTIDLQWHTREVVADESVLRWNTVSFVTDTVDLLWDVLTPVSDESTLRWDTLSAVSDESSLLWDIRQAVADESILRWNIAQAVTDESVLRWNTSGVVTDEASLVWHTSALVSDQLQTIWNINALVADESQLLWNVAGALATVGDEVSLLWNDSGVVGDESSLLWNTAGVVADTVDLLWDIHATAADESVIRWNINATIADTIDLRWLVLSTVADESNLVWGILTTVQDSVTILHNIHAAVTDEAQLLWNVAGVLSTVGDEVSLRWNLISHVGDESVLLWDTRAIVADTMEVLWNTSGTVADTAELVWDTMAVAGDQAELVWDSLALAGDEASLLWNTIQTGTVGDEVSLVWNDAGAVSNETDLLWNTLVTTSDEITALWSILTPVFDAVDIQWSVASAVGDQTELVWDVIGPVGNEANILWAVEGSISDELAMYWNNLTVVSDEASLLWSIDVPVGNEVDILWDVSAAVTDWVFLRWAVRTLTVSRNYVWIVGPFRPRWSADVITQKWDSHHELSVKWSAGSIQE